MRLKPKLRVLLVEPDEDFRYVFGVLLESLGCAVTTVSCSSDALANIRKTVPDVMLTELHLPDTDGREFIKGIRHLPSAGHVVVVGLTGYIQANTKARALDADFDYFFAKPVAIHRIIALLDKVAKSRHGKIIRNLQ